MIVKVKSLYSFFDKLYGLFIATSNIHERYILKNKEKEFFIYLCIGNSLGYDIYSNEMIDFICKEMGIAKSTANVYRSEVRAKNWFQKKDEGGNLAKPFSFDEVPKEINMNITLINESHAFKVIK
jgi:hypothetical protein